MVIADSPALDRRSRWTVTIRKRERLGNALLELLTRTGTLTVAQAVESLGVSEATVRRDFRELAAQQMLVRTHGGVVAGAVTYDLTTRYREAGNDRANQVVVVGTGEKVWRTSFARICAASRIDLLVTDSSAPQAAVEDLRSAGVAVELV